MQRKIRVSTEEKDLIKQYAWSERTDMSKILRAKVEEYVNDGYQGLRLPKVIQRAALQEQITFAVEDELWQAALDRAKQDRVELSGIIRASVIEDFAHAKQEHSERWK
jgi:hypothetical protein